MVSVSVGVRKAEIEVNATVFANPTWDCNGELFQ